MSEKKIRCPNCERCVGIITGSAEAIVNITKVKPIESYKPHLLEKRTCQRCKNLFFIKIYFKN